MARSSRRWRNILSKADESAKSVDEDAKTYLATVAFLNIVGVVLLPFFLMLSKSSDLTRQATCLGFESFLLFSAYVSIRNLLRNKRKKLACFAFFSFLALVIVCWAFIWPTTPWESFGRPVWEGVARLFISLDILDNRGGRKLAAWLAFVGVFLGYVALFSPVMIAIAARQNQKELAGAAKLAATNFLNALHRRR